MSRKQPPERVSLVDLGVQHSRLEKPLRRATARVLSSSDFILGREVALFEEEFARYCEAGYGVGVDSGLSALELSLRALGVGPGDEVITAANTFIATALAISGAGATPVLVDVDPATYTMDIDALERAITPRTKAVVPVHLYGQPADMDPILEIAERNRLAIVEDACQAHGARYKGRRAGSLGHAAAFSFYPAKNLGACGDGGMVVTSDRRVADTVRALRNYGQREKYHHVVRGFNRRLDTLQAAILRVKLPHLDSWNAARRQHAWQYGELLAGCALATPEAAGYSDAVWHLYVVRVSDRDGLAAFLAEKGISTGIHYPVPIHLQPAYSALGYRPGAFPVTEASAETMLSLPMYPELTTAGVEHVAGSIRDFTSIDGDRSADAVA